MIPYYYVDSTTRYPFETYDFAEIYEFSWIPYLPAKRRKKCYYFEFSVRYNNKVMVCL